MVPIMEVRNLTKRYGGTATVTGVSFAIRPGEILGVLGPNGAGKSTIVKMVTGLVEPTSGAVLLRGNPVKDDWAGYKRIMGYVPEVPDLYGFLTGWEYLDMVATLRAMSRTVFRRKAKAMLEGFGLHPHRDRAISTYSKGMRQRIVVTAALLHNPDLLILDEPFSGLDATSAAILRNLIGVLAARGKAVLFSSPVLEQADRLCTHLVLLKRGAVIAEGTMEQVREGFAGLDLEAGFMQLTEQVDITHAAHQIAAATLAC